MSLFTLDELEGAATAGADGRAADAAICLAAGGRPAGAEVWVKHENHTPIGAFKARGGLVYFDWLKRFGAGLPGVITATRGNHGQAVALAGRARRPARDDPRAHGNSAEKNAAMQGSASSWCTAGTSTSAGSRARARRRSGATTSCRRSTRWSRASRPTRWRCSGGARPGRRLRAHRHGLGHLRPDRRAQPARARHRDRRRRGRGSAGRRPVRRAGRPVPTDSAATFADGMACREPHAEALAIIRRGAARIERDGGRDRRGHARPLRSPTSRRRRRRGLLRRPAAGSRSLAGKRVGLALTGGNVDSALFADVLAGRTPQA